MKRISVIISVGIILGLMAFGWYMESGSSVYEKQEVKEVEVEKEVVVDPLEKKIQAAQESKEEEIRAAAQKEYDAFYKAEMAKIKAQVLKEYEDQVRAEREKVEAEYQSY